MYACLHARLSTWYFNYYSYLDGCVEFETCTWTVFQNCIVFLYSHQSPVSVPFFRIRTDPLYWYYFLVLWYMIVISTVLLLDMWLLYAFTWHLLDITYHMFDITYHLPPDKLLLVLWLSYFRNSVMLACIIYSDPYLWYLCILAPLELLNMSCSCYSYNMIIT